MAAVTRMKITKANPTRDRPSPPFPVFKTMAGMGAALATRRLAVDLCIGFASPTRWPFFIEEPTLDRQPSGRPAVVIALPHRHSERYSAMASRLQGFIHAETASDPISSPAPSLGLIHRPRRNRKADWARRLVRENVVTLDDLIWPLFLIAGESRREAVSSMPGVERLTVDEAVRAAVRAARLGIPVLALFPFTDPDLRDPHGSEALRDSNLVCRACRAIKAEVPEIGLLTDVALDPYTSHGHDGLLEGHQIVNDATVRVLVAQALNQARAGADIIAPSDMMDGRVGAIRKGLDAEGFEDVQIMSYAAKYASAFYGPFRDAIGTSAALIGDKQTYQMDPSNGAEALREVELDLVEGADMVMVKPGLPYLDIVHRVKSHFAVPTFAYQVSGEYAMIMAAAANGWIDGDRAMMESLIAFKRAGADGVMSYFAPRVAERLNKGR